MTFRGNISALAILVGVGASAGRTGLIRMSTLKGQSSAQLFLSSQTRQRRRRVGSPGCHVGGNGHRGPLIVV